jgi:hypothetical protein
MSIDENHGFLESVCPYAAPRRSYSALVVNVVPPCYVRNQRSKPNRLSALGQMRQKLRRLFGHGLSKFLTGCTIARVGDP